MAIGKYDRGGAIGPPNRSENDDRGGGDLHRSASFRPPKPERANPDKIQKPSDMVCPRFLSTIFLGVLPDLAFQPGLLNFEGNGADQAAVIGLIWQGFATVGLKADQPDRDRVSSDLGFLIVRSGCDPSDQGQLRALPT